MTKEREGAATQTRIHSPGSSPRLWEKLETEKSLERLMVEKVFDLKEGSGEEPEQDQAKWWKKGEEECSRSTDD